MDFVLAKNNFVMKSNYMNPSLAEENLQTIRTLMERSALYRRALAPIMISAGVLGLLATGTGLYFHVESPKAFVGLWFGAAGVAVVAALLLARRQAFKEQEAFWSPPTRRVGQALLPPLLCGMFIGILCAMVDGNWSLNFPLAMAWLLFYGCALHSAGFFMARGIKWLGWIFIIGAISLIILLFFANWSGRPQAATLTMGFFFGVLHLAYGAYLYLTEKRKNAA